MLTPEFRRIIAQGEGERLWQTFGFTSPEHLDLEDVAFARGVIVTEGRLDNMEARLIRQGEHGLIRIRSDSPETGRKRFAIAHELGHWELHRNVTQLFECTEDDMVARYKDSAVEGEANYFAAGLLMPEGLFSERVKSRPFSFRTVSELATYFRTSLTATAIRCVETSDDYIAVVVSEKGRIRWWRGSSRFGHHFWIQPRSAVSKGTIASSLSGLCRRPEPGVVDVDVWCQSVRDTDSGTFIEESVLFTNYNQILTLLQLP